ncbi:MAG: nucleoside hydrolase [Thermomicrobiales bacterium]
MTAPIPLVIDTDTGSDVDDALAITLALASPEVDLIGVTVVSGDVAWRARMVARILGMAGRADIPIFRGVSHSRAQEQTPSMLGSEGVGLLDHPYDGPTATIHDTPAPDWLIAESCRRPFHLAAIGPFSNVAVAVQRDPTFASRLIHLSVMGGMVFPDHFGTAWRRYYDASEFDLAAVDYNTASDAVAALTAARAGAPMTWVTVELTLRTPLTRQGLEAIEATGSPLGAALGRMGRSWSDHWFRQHPALPDAPSPVPTDSVACLHDPLAIASIFPSDWLTLAPHPLRYEIDGELFRVTPTEDGAHDAVAAVSVAVDAPAFERFFLERVVTFLGTIGSS